ncbi:interleukin-2 receptor subunit beta [Latimeria chalumnae]|uniref:interleukin-2 receptor subunit beta n=1 Tax=Latimeria chalumnae TaxID=7897 RepID=UPI0003C12278|nr:PREDICTED: interleukin-2 receptor subunit beta-like [Latimeria chalumnae]|eukprot:XP_006006944.1 PREDICTED: interleukin-2 receptor subunit beta-like [Latimeria chalumnae]
MTWNSNCFYETYLSKDHELQYEVRYKPKSLPWEESKKESIYHDQRWLWIPMEKMKSYSEYEAQVRIQPKPTNLYKGIWSNWSQAIEWKTHDTGEAWDQQLVQTHKEFFRSKTFLAVMIICAAIALMLTWKLSKWFQKLICCHVPDPSKFFHPLRSVHGGDFKKWVGTPFSAASFSLVDHCAKISPVEVSKVQAVPPYFKKELPPSTETSGQSQSSYANQGYFFFRYPSSYEVDPCQVYFSFDVRETDSSSNCSSSYEHLACTDSSTLEESFLHSPCSGCCVDTALTFAMDQEAANSSRLQDGTLEQIAAAWPTGLGAQLRAEPKSMWGQAVDGQELESGFGAQRGPVPSRPSLPLGSSMLPFNFPFSTTFDQAEIMDANEPSSFMDSNNEGLASSRSAHASSSPEGGSLFKTPSLNLDLFSGAYLSLREVQSKYSNHSI